MFIGALLRGKLVPSRFVAQMTAIVPGSHGQGMGVDKLGSPCGRWYHGHMGHTPGYVTVAAGSRDGRRIVVVTVNGVGSAAVQAIGLYLDDVLC